eukprot:scaffold1485_cov171-Amphora_coffeaeformis.AAC.21
MASTEWDPRRGNPLMSPTQLTKRRGLRRPIPVKSLSDLHSGSQSISSRATSRRSKSIVSTPKEQKLFENISASLVVTTPKSGKNKLGRFQQKKETAFFSSTSDSKKMIHPTQQPSYQDRNNKDESETERYFSQGGSLAIDKPGKVTPIIYNISTSSSSDSCSDETGTTCSSDSDEAFVPLPKLAETLSDEDAFIDLRTKQSQSFRSKMVGYQGDAHEHSTIDVSTAGYSKTTQEKDAPSNGMGAQTTSTFKTLKRLFKNYDDFSCDEECSFDDGQLSIHLSEIACATSDSDLKTTSTLSQSTVTSSIATMDMDQSTAEQPAIDQSAFDQLKSNKSTTEQEYGLLGLTNTNESGREIKTSRDRSTAQSRTRFSGTSSGERNTVWSTEAKSSDTNSNNSRSKTNNASRTSRSDAIDQSTTRSFDACFTTVRTVETNFSDRGTAKSVENAFGNKMVQDQTLNPSYINCEKEKGRKEDDMEEDDDDEELHMPISTSESDVSDITTLSRAQRYTQPIPVMNYSNIFSVGSTSLWSRNENFKRDDDIFMARAETLLDFYESRLNEDKTKLLLVPGDKKEIDATFNATTRLRFVESLRMRCVVKNERTEEIVGRCCRLGLEKEGAQNPIFVTGALGNRKITVHMPKPVTKEDDQSEKGAADTGSLATSKLSCDSAEWNRNKGLFESCCGIPFFCA